MPMMQERQALLGTRENAHATNGSDNVQQHLYESIEAYDACEEVVGDYSATPTKERKPNGGWNLRLAMLCGST
eukprot:scaffold36436_cov176-Amphora_coffeaeformis.AAC.1